MVTDLDKFDCFSTEVSCMPTWFLTSCANYIHAGTGEGGSLERVQFARIINGNLVYDNGESASTVNPGSYSYNQLEPAL